jgi:hypothetical protein
MWPFDQEPNCATFVSTSVLNDGHPILFVSHDEFDHGWQFLDGCNPPSEAIHVCLSHVANLDASVFKIADLPPGWVAWRDGIEQEWSREPHAPEI